MTCSGADGEKRAMRHFIMSGRVISMNLTHRNNATTLLKCIEVVQDMP
jgi:hypothetical protein